MNQANGNAILNSRRKYNVCVRNQHSPGSLPLIIGLKMNVYRRLNRKWHDVRAGHQLSVINAGVSD